MNHTTNPRRKPPTKPTEIPPSVKRLYAWFQRPPSAHAEAEAILLERVRGVTLNRVGPMDHRACMLLCGQTVNATAASGSPG